MATDPKSLARQLRSQVLFFLTKLNPAMKRISYHSDFHRSVFCGRDYGLMSQTQKKERTVMSTIKLFMRFSLVLLSGFSLLAVVLFAALPANAATINEFPIPTADSKPEFITAGPDGNL